jgi:hypothetical protein
MPIYPNPAPSIPAALLAAGIALYRVHGAYYARCFLEDSGVDSSVITELLDTGNNPASWPQYPTEPR